MSELLEDRFAELLGITVARLGPGRTRAELRTGADHTNPHGTVHGAVFYAVAGAAVAAAANDDESSGIITSVLVEYLRPVQPGDLLRAVVEPAASTDREDVFVARIEREPGGAEPGTRGELVAWARARGTRRRRHGPSG